MNATTNLSIRIERSLKDEAESILGELGLSLTTAVCVFLRQAVRQRKIPFEIALEPEDPAFAALGRIWRESATNGTREMTMDEIDAEIAERRANANGVGADALV